MKKIYRLFWVAMIAAFLFTACSPVASVARLVEVPIGLQTIIQIGIEIAVVWVLTQLAKRGLDFSGYRVQIVAALFGTVLVFLNAFLAKVPASLESIVGALLNLLVVVLGSFGVAQLVYQFKQARLSRGTKST